MKSYLTAIELVQMYEMEEHPEGGFFKETYKAKGRIPKDALPGRDGDRSFSTGIFFLLPEGSKSALHKIKSDEMWHFYLGGPLKLIQISPAGKVEEIILGQDVQNGQMLQHVVPAGFWFGAFPEVGSEYSFVGCTVAPGFEFADFEMANREKLTKQFPHAREVIEWLTN